MPAIRCLPLALLVSILTAATGSAEPMLLAELSYEQPEPVTVPADYTFRIADRHGSLRWTETIGSFPFESHADAQSLEVANRILGIADVTGQGQPPMTLFNGDQWPSTNEPHGPLDCFVCAFHPLMLKEHGTRSPAEVAAIMEGLGLSATLHVPFIGPRGLMGYEITDIERSVTAEAQIVRIFGHAVPEPASWLIVFSALLLHLSKRSPASTSRSS